MPKIRKTDDRLFVEMRRSVDITGNVAETSERKILLKSVFDCGIILEVSV